MEDGVSLQNLASLIPVELTGRRGRSQSRESQCDAQHRPCYSVIRRIRRIDTRTHRKTYNINDGGSAAAVNTTDGVCVRA